MVMAIVALKVYTSYERAKQKVTIIIEIGEEIVKLISGYNKNRTKLKLDIGNIHGLTKSPKY